MRVRRPPVPEWRNLQLWTEVAGGAGVRAPGDGPGRIMAPVPVQAGAPRMAKAVAGPGPPADDRIPEGGGERSVFAPWAKGHGALQRVDILDLRSAGRSAAHESRGFRSEAAGTGRVQVFGHRAGTNREGRVQQGGHLRRGAGPGRDSEDADMGAFNAREYLTMWRRAVAALDIADCAQSPYQNRRGGASRDHLLRLRSVPAIQRRGRWAVGSSARIYDKPGRLQQMVNKHSKKWWDLGEKVRLNFRDFYLNGSCPVPRSLRLRNSTTRTS